MTVIVHRDRNFKYTTIKSHGLETLRKVQRELCLSLRLLAEKGVCCQGPVRVSGGGAGACYAGGVRREGSQVVKCKLQDSKINCASLSSEISVL